MVNISPFFFDFSRRFQSLTETCASRREIILQRSFCLHGGRQRGAHVRILWLDDNHQQVCFWARFGLVSALCRPTFRILSLLCSLVVRLNDFVLVRCANAQNAAC
jgi:hypothetical protein